MKALFRISSTLFIPPTLRRLRHGGRIHWKSQAEGTSDATESAPCDILKHAAKKTKPPLLFPWYHGSCLPSRLIQRKEAFSKENVSYETSAALISALTAKTYLGLPFFQVTFCQSWKEELAENCAYAFGQGVAGILSNVYQVPLDKNFSNGNDASVLFRYSNSSERDKNGNKKVNDISGSCPNQGTGDVNAKTEMKSLMEKRLIDLFSSAQQCGRDQIEVYLATEPTGASLHSLHAIPGLSREIAESYPQLLREVIETKEGGSSSSVVNRIQEETGRFETTLIAEVLVYCDESFWVRDLESGNIVQGNDDNRSRSVIHTIRMERVREYKPGNPPTMSNWIITDIDDLLDGNQFYSPPNVKWFLSG